ncbi:putative chromosome segregation ATPase [Carnobacterium sp. 17-4]|uniref:GIY-YIG nuclease family protein n=1 Tax=Carnobacterium sp. (strain 17-4) TaxID=208596 RepID=UPI000205860B|nr:GIY-YIG nuclease family protein [Carnobacterium sp. 17-4]AEB30482.1 putative chromosome segregation ATPase [Carnobacterium sp. 17-4]
MGFFQRFKEYAHLKKNIGIKELEIENLVYRKNSLQEEINGKQELLSNKEKLIQDFRSVVEAENHKKREVIINEADIEAKDIINKANEELSSLLITIDQRMSENEVLHIENTKLQKEITRYMNQARKFKSQLVGLKNFEERFPHTINMDGVNSVINELESELDDESLVGTIIRLHLHSDNSKELKKLSNATKKEIDNLLVTYEKRYTTKANKTIYNLMIIGLQSEMQILLYKLSYEKLDDTKQFVKDIMTKYLVIAAEGNKAILPTITKFISEIEPLYLELVDIEYRYYIYRQREKEEQKAIKEQMKQEAEERKILEAERKKLEQEENKFKTEIERNREILLFETDEIKIKQLNERLLELEGQLDNIENKKEEIASLALGKAGYVYIISNMGSFGDNTFKIGMTRRMEPQQRVDELGSASVPFRFDVHALIFSDNAVGLENELHKRLSNQRVNKVNFRKEFFRTDIATLEILVEEIDPTADFNITMFAEEYNQSLALEENLKTEVLI